MGAPLFELCTADDQAEPASYDIYSADDTVLHGNVTTEQAAEIVNLSVEEIEWAIEEQGRCDTQDMVVVRDDDVIPIDSYFRGARAKKLLEGVSEAGKRVGRLRATTISPVSP
jgi:hypothetical protein